MKLHEVFVNISCLTLACTAQSNVAQSAEFRRTVIEVARHDSIDIVAIPGLDVDAILEYISSISLMSDMNRPKRNTTIPRDIIDVHAHCVPDWYRQIVPTTGGNPTPQWNLTTHLAFMADQGISTAVLAFSSRGANVYPRKSVETIALARLMNEQAAAYAKACPQQFTFYAVVPLPYTEAAILEAKYALDTLGAAGIALYSNFEGHYLGDSKFTAFFAAIDARGPGQIIYIHPTTPWLRVNGLLIEANSTVYPSGIIEFFFETARMLEDLAVTQTILIFTNINYIIPHVGGAWPPVADRLLKSFPAIYNRTLSALQTRFYWDSAGPTYFHQVAGLLAYNIPTTQLLFGSDFPYAPIFTYAASLLGVKQSTFVGDGDRLKIFRLNAETLFGNALPGNNVTSK